jgi:putative flavoprotein involved in K+ transport
LDLPEAIAANGYPKSSRGISLKYDGLYFVGSSFQHSLTSTWMGGVGRDAAYVVKHLCENKISHYIEPEKSYA